MNEHETDHDVDTEPEADAAPESASTPDGPRTDDEKQSDARRPSSELRTDGGEDEQAVEPADEEAPPPAPGGVPPDDETPTWRQRKERTTGLSRLTYEYFERARYEDQELREESDYVERDVLGFPYWPHEFTRNMAIVSFFVGMTMFLAATLPPHIGAPANPSQTPAIILPDWYLLWTFGLLKLGPLNPQLAILGGEQLMSDRVFGVVVNIVVVGFIAIVPFLNKGNARRPVEQPFWASVGVTGVVFAVTISILSIKNLVPIAPHLLFDLTFILPPIGGCLSYALLKSMRQGYMYDLNKRYYRLRPPK